MSTEIQEPQLQVITGHRPQGRKAGGRAKSPLTIAIEALQVGDTLVTGLSVAGVTAEDEKRILGNVRSKTGAASKDNEKKFSVFPTEGDEDIPDGSVVVFRSE